MKLKNLLKLYKMSKDWEFIDGKLSIPESILSELDIRMGDIKLQSAFNPLDINELGTFMPDMTEEDYQKWMQQKSGWAKFYDKVNSYVNKKSN